MNCQPWREWIAEAALGSLDSSCRPKLDRHLAACAHCRRAFEAEQKLLAAVDDGLRASLTGTPSSEFVPRVRMRIAQESETARAWWLMPLGRIRVTAAVAALAALVLAVGLLHRASPPAKASASRIAGPAVSSVALNEVAGVATPAGSALTPARPADSAHDSARRMRRRQRAADDQAPQCEVLVEPGQWRAIVAAYRAAQSERVDADLTPDRALASEKPVEVTPIEIDPIAVAELYPAGPPQSPGR